MKHVLSILMLLIVSCSLVGCGSWLGDGRMKAWQEVRQSEEQTNQDFLAVKKEEFKAEQKKQTTQNPTLKITTYDQNGKVLSITEMDMQPTIAEITGGKRKDNTYGVNLQKTDMPTGEFAENALALGDGATKLAGSPAVLAGTVLYMNKETVQAMPDGNRFEGENINIDNAFNKPEVHATGEGNTITYTGTSPAQVVKPEVIENK